MDGFIINTVTIGVIVIFLIAFAAILIWMLDMCLQANTEQKLTYQKVDLY
jgi:hypothetical protein